MGRLARALALLILLGAIGGAAYVAIADLPPPNRLIEEEIAVGSPGG
jgi:hypothetical protein